MNFIKVKKINKISGFSLLELVLAVAVFSLSSFALATLIIDSNISTKLSQEKIIALSYAKEGVNIARFTKNSAWADLVSTSTTLDDKYLRETVVTDDPIATSTKNVSVSVSWDLTAGRRATTTLYTILTNWASSTSP